MNNTYYTVRIAIKGNMIVGTAMEIVHDYAMPYDKTWFRDEYTFKEKSFETLQEAQETQNHYDRLIGINFDEFKLVMDMEKAYIVKEA